MSRPLPNNRDNRKFFGEVSEELTTRDRGFPGMDSVLKRLKVRPKQFQKIPGPRRHKG